ncbi:MAG: hypothetical protein M3R32_03610 [Chloroflexota bacterium]|nr:hypothetical protein [Chloroflexota bacterium]
MIGGAARPRLVAILATVLVVGIGLGLRSGDPSRADPAAAAARAERLADAAAAADQALAKLGDVLARALDRARTGSALAVAGDLPPAPELTVSADALAKGAGSADAVRRALLALAGTAASVAPGRETPTLSYSGPDLLLISSQLRSSADAATVFVARRHATTAIVSALAEAAAALDGNQPAAAIAALDRAKVPLALLNEWQDQPPLFRYWMTIIGDLLDAARGIATAAIKGDRSEVEAAAKRYATAAAVARGADNALAVTLSEGGAAVSDVPLRRLAALAQEATDTRAALAPLLRPGS